MPSEHYNPVEKKIGCYLVDAGLVTAEQVNAALGTQKSNGMKLGEILVMQGWIKKQTLEYVMGKVITLERSLGKPLNKTMLEQALAARTKRKKGAL